MPDQSQLERDVLALGDVARAAWKLVDPLNVPDGVKSAMVGATVIVLGQAYLKDRARYDTQEETDPPKEPRKPPSI